MFLMRVVKDMEMCKKAVWEKIDPLVLLVFSAINGPVDV